MQEPYGGTMYFDPTIVNQGQVDVSELADDNKNAARFADEHLGSLGHGDGGPLFNTFLEHHDDDVKKLDEVMTATRTLLTNASGHIASTIEAYAQTEQANVDEVKKLWTGLDTAPTSAGTNGAPAVSAAGSKGPAPSTLLKQPANPLDSPILNLPDVLDLLSFAGWVKRAINETGQLFFGMSTFEYLWTYLGGDFKQIYNVGGSWGALADYYDDDLPAELGNRVALMFQGWSGGADADQAAQYFTAAGSALTAVGDPLAELATLYKSVAISSSGFMEAVSALLDSLADLFISGALAGLSVGEIIAVVFTFGLSAPEGIATGFVAIWQAVMGVIGLMTAAFNTMLGIGGLIAASMTDINWVTLPEG